jgi:hypothetical protein
MAAKTNAEIHELLLELHAKLDRVGELLIAARAAHEQEAARRAKRAGEIADLELEILRSRYKALPTPPAFPRIPQVFF